MADLTPVVLCFKWGKGYPVTYTNILYHALRDIMQSDFRFVCMTDDSDGLATEIETIAFPAFRLDRAHWNNGMWPKLCAFAPGLFAPGTPVLMLDVDIVVLRDLTPFFERLTQQGGLHIMREIPDTLPRLLPRIFGKPLLSNSSVVGFLAETQGDIFEKFKDATQEQLGPVGNDQNFIHHTAKNRQSWPAGWVLSFKKSCVFHFPVNLLRPIRRPDGYIVIFHGVPKPEDVIQPPFKRWGTAEKFGVFPVPWVKSYWQRYAQRADL